MFLGVHGMDRDGGLTTPNLLEAETDRAMVAAAGQLVVLADHTKWGETGLSRIADLADVDLLVTDAVPDGLDAARPGHPPRPYLWSLTCLPSDVPRPSSGAPRPPSPTGGS